MKTEDYTNFFRRGPAQLRTLNERLEELLEDNHRLTKKIEEYKVQLQAAEKNIENLRSHVEQVDDRTNDALHRVSSIKNNIEVSEATVASHNSLLVDNHELDGFYMGLEKYFRGSEEEIKQRQSQYKDKFQPLKKVAGNKPVIDIGCGRGEFLALLKEWGVNSIGLDLNAEMVEQSTKNGHEAVQSDAVKWLYERETNSIAAITGFHIVEHIPFATLIPMFEACYRSLMRGGFVLFETPNPENLNVGSCTFWMDPSHIQPIPPAMLEYAIKFSGFRNTEIIRLHPMKVRGVAKLPQDTKDRLYGPRDYAVIGYK